MAHIKSDYHVKFADVFFYQHHYFIVTELIEHSIEDLINVAERTGPRTDNKILSEDFSSYTLYCLCEAVRDMHNGSAIHRNISPANIFVAQDTALLSNMKDSVFLVKDRKTRSTQVGLQIY